MCYEDGAKNPLKSIPVKRLVPAFFAQIRVGAGYEHFGLFVTAYKIMTQYAWRLKCVHYLDNVRLKIKPTMWLAL